jgi:hypothetical protein
LEIFSTKSTKEMSRYLIKSCSDETNVIQILGHNICHVNALFSLHGSIASMVSLMAWQRAQLSHDHSLLTGINHYFLLEKYYV